MESNHILGKIELFTKEQAESMSVKMSFEKAPLIIHQAFCGELVRIAKEQKSKPLNEIPEVIKVMDAIEVLEKLYPQLEKIKTK